MSWRLSKQVGALLLLAFAGFAQAALLSPGSTLALPGTTATANPALAGVVDVDAIVPVSFAANGGNIAGDVQVRVVRSIVDHTLDRFAGAFDSHVNHHFDDALAPGLESRFFFLDTNAVDYARNTIYDLTYIGQTKIGGRFSTHGPAIKVPEPASVALLALSLALLGWVARRPLRVRRVVRR